MTVELSGNQFDALVSFAYNVGTGAFRGSTLLRRLNAGEYDAVPSELARWNKSGGVVLPGLTRRRAAEGRMFTSGDYSTGASLRRAHAFQTQPRGVRNNNPGNIRISNNDWDGKVPRAENTDGAFEQFTSYAYGVRALILLLRNYITRGNPPRNTLRRIIDSYAPASDNNHVENYVNFLIQRFGAAGMQVTANSTLTANRATLRVLVKGIARFENGQEAVTDEQFDAGFALLPENVRTSIGQSLTRGFSADAITEAELLPEGAEQPDEAPPSAAMTVGVPAHCPVSDAADASTQHFSLSEFHSKDGTDVPRALRGNIQVLMEQLEVLRSDLGDNPIAIVSGYRSPAHNASVNGAAQSQHLCGRAADIRISGYTPAQVAARIEDLIADGRMLQGGLSAYATFTHYDTRGRRARW